MRSNSSSAGTDHRNGALRYVYVVQQSVFNVRRLSPDNIFCYRDSYHAHQNKWDPVQCRSDLPSTRRCFIHRYDAVNAMLLNEFLKEHRKVQELESARIAEQKEIADLKQQLKAHAAAIQKVNDKVELTKPAPQRAVNDR